MVQAFPHCGKHRDQILATQRNEAANVSKLEHLYCVTNSLRKTVTQLKPNMIVRVSEITNIEKMEAMYEEFSGRCKNYTQAMSLKHLLQNYLLNDSSAALKSDQAKSYSSLLVSLQTISNILDDIEFIEHKRHCVTLTTAQYKEIYYVPYKKTSLLEEMQTAMQNWLVAIIRDLGAARAPNPCTCKIVYLTA